MAWSQRQEESRKKKCQKKRSKQWLGGWFSSGGAHRVPGTPGPLLRETRGYLWISFPPQRPRSEWEAAPHRWTEWAATQQRTHQWWCLSLKTRQNKNELRCPPSPGFYGASWHRMCLRTSLSARGLSSHLVYTCKEGTQTSKHDQLRSVLSGIFTRNCFSERIGLKKKKKTSASATLLFMQRSSDGAVCSSPHNWAAGTARVKQRGDSGESLSDLRGCETQTPANKKKRKENPIAVSAEEENITFYSHSLALEPWLLTAPCPGSISQGRTGNIFSYVMWQFPPEGQVGLLLWVVHHDYTNNSDLWFAAQRERDQVSTVQEKWNFAMVCVFLLRRQGFC